MKSLKSKASQLFKNTPSHDERAANASPSQEADFDAGIEQPQQNLRKKRGLRPLNIMTQQLTPLASRFFRKQTDKPLLIPPVRPKFSRAGSSAMFQDDVKVFERVVDTDVREKAAKADKPLPSRPVSVHSAASQVQIAAGEDTGVACPTEPEKLVIRKRPSFVSLRKTSSRIFRAATGDHESPPPIPQVPIDTPTPKPGRPILRPLISVRSGHSSRSISSRAVSISRPVSSAQPSSLSTALNFPRVPFNKPSSPAPPRPARTQSIDWDLVALSRDYGSRMMLPTSNRVRTPTVSTTSSARSRALTRVGSEEAYARLGLPSGHSSVSTPRSLTFESSLESSTLAANFMLDPNNPLPFRDSSGSVKGYGRFSAYIKARQGYKSGAYDDGVDREERELGPIEMYRESKCGDWTLEKRVSGKLGDRGMLFRDRWGGWHFVADI